MTDVSPALQAPSADGHAPLIALQAPRAAAPRGLSMASLILGVAGLLVGWGFLGVPSIVAVVLGHLALRREPEGRTLAVGGLALGYVGIAVGLVLGVLIVIALTLPFAFLAVFPAFTAL